MKKATRIFIVAVDEDAFPGAFDASRIEEDVRSVLERSIPHYNPKVEAIDRIIRDSNFSNDVITHYRLDGRVVTFEYKAER